MWAVSCRGLNGCGKGLEGAGELEGLRWGVVGARVVSWVVVLPSGAGQMVWLVGSKE